MTTASLKQAAEQAQAAYEDKKAELVSQGLKSQERYALLKDLKAAADAAQGAYAASAKRGIHTELTKIINGGAPALRAAKIARSPWLQAKLAAGLKV